MKRVKYKAKRLALEDVHAYTKGFTEDLDDLETDSEYTLFLFVGEAPPKQEENIECTIDYDNI